MTIHKNFGSLNLIQEPPTRSQGDLPDVEMLQHQAAPEWAAGLMEIKFEIELAIIHHFALLAHRDELHQALGPRSFAAQMIKEDVSGNFWHLQAYDHEDEETCNL